MTVWTLAILLLVLLPGVVLWLARRQRPVFFQEELSAISRQHIELAQGGQLNEAAVESTKSRFRELLERGQVDAVERSLQAGMGYVVQVRALAELGTEVAGRILEGQLQRRLSNDQIEQAWYWIDVASCLRTLNRSQSLPQLLKTAELTADGSLSQFFAAETICFPDFANYLRPLHPTLGTQALRVLIRAMEGLRCGLSADLIAESRLGELIEILWDQRRETVEPLVVRAFAEALRILRRGPHLACLVSEGNDREAFDWQLSRLASLQLAIEDYLAEAIPLLCQQLPTASLEQQRDILATLNELQANAGESIIRMLAGQAKHPLMGPAIALLRQARQPHIGQLLRDLVLRRVPVVRRARCRPRNTPLSRPSVGDDLPYAEILQALRGHPSPQTEALLLLAARDWDPTYRLAAVSSLGWWEPIQRADVLLTLQEARRDGNPAVRLAARAALARLGERQSLNWFRQQLTSEDSDRTFEIIQLIAAEELTLLWPDLDRLVDSENADVAYHAREALIRLDEQRENTSRLLS